MMNPLAVSVHKGANHDAPSQSALKLGSICGNRSTSHVAPNPPNRNRTMTATSANHGIERSKYLMFFYDVETTGLGINDDRIVEIGAAVFGDASKPNVTFNQLVYTDVRIPRRVTNLTGITNSMLTGKKPFRDVFAEFLQWIDATVYEVSLSTDVRHIPVLVAYNGFRFDYPITLAEIQRNSLSCADIINRGIHFADTYHLLQQVKSSGRCPALSDMPLKMKGLIDAFVPSHNYNHRALDDVIAMVKLFHLVPFSDLLSCLVVRSPQEQLQRWENRASGKA